MNKTYIKVDSTFDETGHVTPISIIWNGKSWTIDEVRTFRNTDKIPGLADDGLCYTIVIKGQERHLFFERTDRMFSSLVGRWFVTTNK